MCALVTRFLATVVIFFIFPPNQGVTSDPFSGYLDIHQLCKRFEWVGDPMIGRLSTSSSFADCVKIKVHLVPDSDLLYVTVSTSNRHTCGNYKIQAFALSLVALPIKTQFYDRGIPVGSWSRITSGAVGAKFPELYLQNNQQVTTPTCSKPEDDEDLEDTDIFYFKSQINSLVYKGQLLPGSGVAAQVKVDIPTGDPTPVQLAAEFLIGIDPEKSLNYWIYDGSFQEMMYYPKMRMIKASTNPTGKLFLLDPAYQKEDTSSVVRVVRQPFARITYMCACHDPTRDVGGVPNSPATVIPQIPGTSTLTPCFEMKVIQCPGSTTLESLGALFIQKPCTPSPNVRTIDISFIAMNQKGFAYGELEINKLVRPCFTTIPGATGLQAYRPVVNTQNPVTYTCNNAFAQADTLFPRDPVWLSVDADFQVLAREKPRVVQIMLKDKINTGTAGADPTDIQFVAEISVELAPGGPKEIHRVVSPLFELHFTATGDLDWSVAPVIKASLPADPNYLAEAANVTCGPPTACTTCPNLDPAIFLCRKIETDVPSSTATASVSIEPCLKTVFNNQATAPKNEFFMSLEIDISKTGCSGMVIKQSVFMVTERDGTNTVPVGTWAAAQLADFTGGKCKNALSRAPSLEPSVTDAIQHCDTTVNDNQLYYHHQDIGNRMICGKWSYSGTTTIRREIQAGAKLYYQNGATEHHHIYRDPTIYEVQGTGPTMTVEKIITASDLRTDILLATQFPTFSQPAITLPILYYRNTYMCSCNDPTRVGGIITPVDATTAIPEIGAGSTLTPCFELKIQNCVGSLTGETMGAVFIQKPCTPSPSVRTVDISFVALNENGFAYGELVINELSTPCFVASPGGTGLQALSYRPVVHKQDPIAYACTNGFVQADTLFPRDPVWLSVDADFQVAAGENPRAVQVMLKDRIKTGATFPSKLRFVAEFSVEISPGGPKEIHRVMSETFKLEFLASGNLDWSKTAVTTPHITSAQRYLLEASPPTCGTPLPCTTCPTPPDPTIFLCRQLESDLTGTTATASNSIEQCLKTVFATPSAGPKNEFYMSLEIDKTIAGCAGMTILQNAFMVTERDATNVVPAGSWSVVASTDFAVGKCKVAGSTATSLENGRKHSLQHCDISLTDNQIYYNQQDIGNRMICGKWTYTGTKSNRREIQAGVKLYYKNGANKHHFIIRDPTIYEVTGTGSTMVVSKVSTNPNERIDILTAIQYPTFTSQPVIPITYPRNTYMCSCNDPTRVGGIITPINASLPILEIGGGSSLTPCFELQISSCPDSLTAETLGAVFIQKPCPPSPTVRTVDISFIALNENGFAYGELVVNDLARPCIELVPGATGPLAYRPVIHNQNPIVYTCNNGFTPMQTMYFRDPSWLSVEADLQVAFAEKPRAVQVMLKDKMRSAASFPSQLRFVAEFSVEMTPGGAKETHRVMSDTYQLGFKSGGDFDWSTSTKITPDIIPDLDYLDAPNPLTCGSPQPCSACPPTPDPSIFLCRKLETDVAGSTATASNSIEPCLKTVFNNPSTGSKNEFYMSMEIDTSVAGCGAIEIFQSAFMVTERDGTNSGPAGKWGLAQSADFVVDKCKDTSTAAAVMEPGHRSNLKSCSVTTNDNLLYYYQHDMGNRLVCGKWTYSGTSSKRREIQAGVKLVYKNGATEHHHIFRDPTIYEVTGTGSTMFVSKASADPNERIDILLSTQYPSFSYPPITRSFPRMTYMCSCNDPTRDGGIITPVNPRTPIPEVGGGSSLSSCFELKLQKCPNSLTNEKLGAVFIQKPCTPFPSVRTVDISFVALNENGFAYGELVTNNLVRPCLDIISGQAGLLTDQYQPVIHHQNPIPYTCTNGFSSTETLFSRDPLWLSVEANFSVLPGEKPRVVQVILKDKIKSGGSYPSTLRFVAEFAVEMSPGGAKQIHRVMSSTHKLEYLPNGTLDWPKTQVAITPDILPDSDYLLEASVPTCGAPQLCTTCLTRADPSVFLCRKLAVDVPGSTATPSSSIETCMRVVFSKPSTGSPDVFYMSMEVDKTISGCSGMKILQSAFMVTERDDQSNVGPVGKWDLAQAADFVVGKCKDTTSTSIGLEPGFAKIALKPCDIPTNDQLVYYHQNDIADRMVCAKWTYTNAKSSRREIQAGVKLYYTDGTSNFHHIYRNPLIYEVINFGSMMTVEQVNTNPNERIDILRTTQYPTFTGQPAIIITYSRNTYMCACKDPTRDAGIITPIDPSLHIKEIGATSPLTPCFSLKLDHCPYSLTGENVGAIFIQNPCPPAPDVRTVDISFVALNENGFAYGELEVNKLIRPCFDSPTGAQGLQTYKPVIHLQNPIQYTCTNGFVQAQTLFSRDPSWLSIDANFSVKPGDKPSVIQVMLKDQINTGGASFPNFLRFVAEFSVELSPGGAKEIHRIMSPTYQLAWKGSTIDWASTVIVTGASILPDVFYLFEASPPTCGVPQICSTCPAPPDPSLFLCRKIESDVTSSPVTASDAIEQCLKTVFNHPPTGPVEEFYVSFQVDTSKAGCGGIQILQSVMMVTGRNDRGSITPVGVWDKVEKRDFVTGVCKDLSTTATALEPPHTLSVDSCTAGTSDNLLYHIYQDVGDRMVCAKWKYAIRGAASKILEIQAGVKFYYKDGSNDHHHIVRLPKIYEFTGSGTSLKVVELMSDSNNRTDIYLTAPLPTWTSQPTLAFPTYRESHMCDCVNPRRAGGTVPQTPADTLPEIDPANTTDPLGPCFEFKLVQCPRSPAGENVGAIFIQKPCVRDPDVRTIDVSFLALNENGFPYGDLEINKLVRPCFVDILAPDGVMAYQPIIHDQVPVQYKCLGLPQDKTLYTDPSWLSVDADLKVLAGDKPRVIQVTLKNKIKQATLPSYPNEIQFVAEFSVVRTSGATELRRIFSQRGQLQFATSGEINWASTTLTNTPIPTSADFLVESTRPSSCPPPTACFSCPSPDKIHFLCRKTEADAVTTTVTVSNAIEICLRTVFNRPSVGPKNEFYVSMEVDVSNLACNHFKIIQNIFMVLERTKSGVKVVGTWDKAEVTDFVVDKCKDTSSVAPKLHPHLKFSIESCTAPPSLSDKQLYHNYLAVDDRMVCAKWTYASTSTVLRELQAGVEIYYEDTNTGAHFRDSIRFPYIYEVTGSGSSISANKIISDTNERINIYWPTPPILPPPPIRVPEFRKSYMCQCLDPRRDPGGVAQPPVDKILDLIPPDPTDTLNGCFKFEVANCPGSLTDENLGAVFSQNPCPADPNVRTIDVFFVALNENGYPYGELEVNTLVRPCFTGVTGPTGILSHAAVIHEQNPITYGCPNAPDNLTIYKNPTWLSVQADFQVLAGQDPRVMQVMLKKKVNQIGTAKPTEIQFVAEFSVELSSGNIEFRRIITERRRLLFTSTGDLDPTATIGSPVLTPHISAHPDYLTELTPQNPCPQVPTQCPTTTCLNLDPNFFVCRRIQADDSGVPADPKIEPCVRTLFTYQTTSAGTDWYASMEFDSTVAGCSSMKVTQSLFMVMERDKTGVHAAGEWSRVDPTMDFVNGRCKDATTSRASALQPGLRFSLEDCEPSKGTNDHQLYHNYKDVGNRMVCAKWTYNSTSTVDLREIQAGVKLFYNDGTNDFIYTVRMSEIYELNVTAGATNVEKVVGKPNNRTDILLDQHYPTFLVEATIGQPVSRLSHMCGCIQPMRSTGVNATPYIIEDVIPPSISSCFDFKLSNCPDTHTSELLGAVFVLKGLSQGCPLGVKLLELSVVAINENGYAYGQLEPNQDIKMCFATGNPYPDLFTTKPVLHEMGPLEYDCEVLPESLHPQPRWLSIAANVESEGTPFPGYQGTVFQFVLRDKVKVASTLYPASVQFIAEFGVVEGSNPYTIYRIRTEQRLLQFTGSDQVDYIRSTVVSSPSPNIDLHSDYLDEINGQCLPPKPAPSGPGAVQDFICECIAKCSGSGGSCGPPDPDVEECFEVIFNHPTGSTASEFYMSVRPNPTGTNCSVANIIIHDVLFTTLQRNPGQPNSFAVGEWSLVDDSDFPQYTTVGSCIDRTIATLNPRRSSRHSIRNCSDGNLITNAFYWHYRALETSDHIMCAKLGVPVPASEVVMQTGYQIVYSDGPTGALKTYKAMHPKIFKLEPTGPPLLVYDKENDRVMLHTFSGFQKGSCFPTPVPRHSHMCDCLNPQRPSGTSYPLPIMELEADTTGLRSCFEFKMVDCSESHTNDRLGAVFIQQGEACGKIGLKTISMNIIAINEDGYPYGEMEPSFTSGECLDTSPGAAPGILDYRPVVNQLEKDQTKTYNWASYQCRLHHHNRTKYINAAGVSKLPRYLTIGLNIESSFTGPSPRPQILQVMLKERVMTGAIYPATIQFIAEFTIRESRTSPVKAFRVATENRQLSFASSLVDFAASTVITAIPRIELHPDYIDLNPATDETRCGIVPGPPPTPVPPDWTTCHCFQWEKPPTTNANTGELIKLYNCLSLSFNYDSSITTTPTFFFSVAKLSSSNVSCADIAIEQFVLTIVGRQKSGRVDTMTTPFGKWDRADISTDYVPGKCLPVGATVTNYRPMKTGKSSIRGCIKDPAPATPAIFFYYKGLRRDGDINCGKWEVGPTLLNLVEVQVIYKIQFYETSNPARKIRAFRHYPLIYEIKGSPQVVYPVSHANVSNLRGDILWKSDPIVNPTGKPCIKTPFVPTSDICDCTKQRHGGFLQVPDKTIVEELSNALPSIQSDCFEFKMEPCTLFGGIFDTVGAILKINNHSTTPACTEDILVEDVAFVVLNGNGYPFGEPKIGKYTRVCLQPADLLQYEIRKLDFAQAYEGSCTSRVRSDGTAFDVEYEYGGKVPTWVQVKLDADVPRLEKPMAIQVYLNSPPTGTSATQVQFIAEMVIMNRASSKREIYRIKTQVYNIGYSGGKFDPTRLIPNTALIEIERSDEWYETEDHNRFCHEQGHSGYGKMPADVQQCACFSFTDGGPSSGTLLDSTSTLYNDHIEKCIFYEWTVVEDPIVTGSTQDVFLYLTVWTKTTAEEANCGNFQVIGMTLTPLIQYQSATGKNAQEQQGKPFGDWYRTTLYAPGFTPPPGPYPTPNISRGSHCTMNPTYSGKLRRLPYDYTRDCTKLTSQDKDKLLLFYYPLLNQDDSGNAFCGALRIDQLTSGASTKRFEFQLIGYLFMEFTTPPVKYYTIKRSRVFEYYGQGAAPPPGSTPTLPAITFPGRVFEAQEESQMPTDCKIDVCIYN